MDEKQKKSDKFSGINSLQPKISDEEIKRLQKERIFKFPEIITSNSQSIDNVPLTLPSPRFRGEEENGGTNNFASQAPNFLPEDWKPKTSKKKTNQEKVKTVSPETSQLFALPTSQKKIQQKRFRALNIRTWAVFVGMSLLAMTAFPLFRQVEATRKTTQHVLGVATSGYDSFSSGSQAFLSADFLTAQESFSQSYKQFSDALSELSSIPGIGFISQGEQGQKLLLAAQEASLSMQYFASGISGLLSTRVSPGGIITLQETETKAVLATSLNHLKIGVKYIESVKVILASINPDDLPEDYRVRLLKVANMVESAEPVLQQLTGFAELASLNVSAESKTYLLLFQNNRELRATGGFIGTYGILKLSGANIEELLIDTVYNPDGQLKENIAPPGPLQRTLTNRWAMRDSNWFYDFPTSANKAAEFFKLETGREVDGVIAFTPQLFIDLMNIIGPIEMPEYKVTLTPENFMDVVQYQTSEVYDRRLNQPKKFLADFTPRLLTAVSSFTSEQWIKSVDAVLRSLNYRDTQLASFRESEQKTIKKLGWSGEIRAAPHDYLAVVASNVGAGKTDQNIEQTLSLQTKVREDGSLINQLTLTRTHNPGQEKEFPTNVGFVRFFVPEGSKLLSASGFEQEPFRPSALEGSIQDSNLAAIDLETVIQAESGTLIYPESGKTVYANWIVLDPGEQQTIELEYVLPLRYNVQANSMAAHSLLLQRQAGSPKTHVELSFTGFSHQTFQSVFPQDLVTQIESTLTLQTDLVSDLAWGFIMSQNK